MAQVQVYNQEGKKTSKLELADSVFGIEPNEYAMHLAVVSYLANQRQGTQSTLTRSEVSGGGAKPWRQKGHPFCSIHHSSIPVQRIPAFFSHA